MEIYLTTTTLGVTFYIKLAFTDRGKPKAHLQFGYIGENLLLIYIGNSYRRPFELPALHYAMKVVP